MCFFVNVREILSLRFEIMRGAGIETSRYRSVSLPNIESERSTL